MMRDKEKLRRIADWCRAYPLTVFPEPSERDWQEAQRLLATGGMTLDRLSASTMRHVLKGVLEIIDGKEGS
jgi:hypothetical protein